MINRQPTRGAKSSTSGYSLVELIVVITIIGIVATVGVGRFFDRQSIAARAFSEELGQLMLVGQRLAKAQRRDVTVSLNFTAGSARLCFDSNCTQPVPEHASFQTQVSQSDGLRLSATNDRVTFDVRGRPGISDVLEIQVLGSTGAQTGRRIRLVNETGHVQTL